MVSWSRYEQPKMVLVYQKMTGASVICKIEAEKWHEEDEKNSLSFCFVVMCSTGGPRM
jgi:hypothetical protein